MRRFACFILLALASASPAFAAEGYVEGLYDGAPLCLIADVRGQSIFPVPESETQAPPARGGSDWTLSTLDGPVGQASGGAPALEECGCLLTPQVALTPAPALTGLAIAANLPLGPAAKLERLSTDNPAYVKAARNWLDEHGLALAPVRLTQVLRTDLEGDGVDEVLLAGSYNVMAVADADFSVGRYAFVLLRKLVDGAVVTSALEAYFDPHPYAVEEVIDGLVDLETVAVADVTGDGVAEVVVAVRLYEGLAFTLYRLEGAALTAAAECGCGC